MPNYNKLYKDILYLKFPEKIGELEHYLSREILLSIDVIKINNLMFGNSENINYNQKLKSYDEESIRKILEFQEKNKLSNTSLSKMYRLSRNTISRWKSCFSDK
jgi:hypothetical protein